MGHSSEKYNEFDVQHLKYFLIQTYPFLSRYSWKKSDQERPNYVYTHVLSHVFQVRNVLAAIDLSMHTNGPAPYL